jgi:hypothetical protein
MASPASLLALNWSRMQRFENSTAKKGERANMRNNRFFSLIMVIGVMALAIALVANTGTAATQRASIDGALLLNRHNPRPEAAGQVAMASDAGQASAPDNVTLSVSPHGGRRSTGITLDQRTRDAIQARWLARYGGTNRTCVLLCGGW